MKQVVALILVPVLSGIASADGGPFQTPSRYVPVTITLTVDREYPDHVVFVVRPQYRSSSVVQRVTLSPSEPMVFRTDEDHLRPTPADFVVYAVPREVLDRLGQPVPNKEWFNPDPANPFLAGDMIERGRLSFDDDRERVEKVYRLEILPEGSRVVLVSENAGNRWVKLACSVVCYGFPTVAIALFGIWLARRLFRIPPDRGPPTGPLVFNPE